MRQILEEIAAKFRAALYTEQDARQAAEANGVTWIPSGACFHKYTDGRTWCCPTTYFKLCPEERGNGTDVTDPVTQTIDLVLMPCVEHAGVWHAYLMGDRHEEMTQYFKDLGQITSDPNLTSVTFREEDLENVVREIMKRITTLTP